MNKLNIGNDKACFSEIWKLQDIVHEFLTNSKSKNFKYKFVLEELDQDYPDYDKEE